MCVYKMCVRVFVLVCCESEMRSAKLRKGTEEKIVMVNTRENL